MFLKILGSSGKLFGVLKVSWKFLKAYDSSLRFLKIIWGSFENTTFDGGEKRFFFRNYGLFPIYLTSPPLPKFRGFQLFELITFFLQKGIFFSISILKVLWEDEKGGGGILKVFMVLVILQKSSFSTPVFLIYIYSYFENRI